MKPITTPSLFVMVLCSFILAHPVRAQAPPGQAATSIFVELGNGDKFIFDVGEGSIANYVAGRVALNAAAVVGVARRG